MAGIITNLYDGLDDAWRYESDYGSYKDDIPLILELARESGGAILEIGAGTGRVAIQLARNGLEVTALEKSDGMSDLLEKKLTGEESAVRSLVKPLRGEMIGKKFDKRFNLIVLAFNFLQLATSRKDRLALLKACHHTLINNGRVYAEVSMPHTDYMSGGKSGRKYVKTFFDRSKRQWVTLFQSHEYNPAFQELTLEYMYLYLRNDGIAEKITRFATLSVIFPVELEGIFEEAGFRISNLWGGFSREPLSADSSRLVLIAVKP